MASKGIIIVPIININTKFPPLKEYLANPKPAKAESITVEMETTTATINELKILRI